MNPGQQIFGTQEGSLAYCLYIAGCQMADPSQICKHIYTPEILAGLGFQGSPLWGAAQVAWKNKSRGHVEFSFVLTARTGELIKAYRDQRKELEESDAKASDLVLKIAQQFASGAMLSDEMLLRVACVNLKIRSAFMNAYKDVIPLLKIPDKGKTEKFETTATGRDAKGNSITVPAHGVKKPGYKLISLNASEETKRKLGFA